MNDFKSFLIGFLMCTCMFLFMGATSNDGGQGKYQAFASDKGKFLIDTNTGETWILGMRFNNRYWEKYIDANDFRK